MISRIRAIRSYDDTPAIHSFVEDVLSAYLSEAGIGSLKAKTVVLKPNWVQESHEVQPHVWEPVITHPSIILIVVEVLAERMEGSGTVIICDAPQSQADFGRIIERGGLKDQLEKKRNKWPGLVIELLDLRREIWKVKDGVVVERREGELDPAGYVRVDLGEESLFYGHPGEGSYYGADYDSNIVNAHHSGRVQEYLIAGTAMNCDLFINLPKMKTHKKTGITCCLKNLVGINGDKNWLPHHTEGGPSKGGDEFPDARRVRGVEKLLKKGGQRLALKFPVLGTFIFRRARAVGKAVLGDSETTIRSGNWAGNDTCWRMALDLNRALIYGNPDGTLRAEPFPRNYFAIVDGIVGGEGNGPLCPDPVDSGVIVAGDDPAEVDAVVSKLMGFRPDDLPVVREAFRDHRWPISAKRLQDIEVLDDRMGKTIRLSDIAPAVGGGFRPHFGWMNLLARTRN
jgi:uncharacterized protein (DUF362 family)